MYLFHHFINNMCLNADVTSFFLEKTNHMANADTSAQHYFECEDCEERPSKFLCKTCSGHLCETCRKEHGIKKTNSWPRGSSFDIKQPDH